VCWRLSPAAVFVAYLVWRLAFYIIHPDTLFSDTQEYYRATQAWVSGGDPWAAVSDFGVRFAAPPPALLLNLPLLPFGEQAARFFWPIAGAVGMAAAVRHYRLPAWWMLFPPFVEGWTAGASDPALLGLMLVGGGAISALVKPYAIPGMLGERRYLAVGVAVLLGLVSLPVLPWITFLQRLPEISGVLAAQAKSQIVITGLLALLATAAAVASLRRRGLLAATPALWPNAQLHYALFSLAIAGESPLLAIAFALPGLAPLGVILYAGMQLLDRQGLVRLQRDDGGRGPLR
jgi:hypothetical protein